MASNASMLCPPPFYPESNFGSIGGQIDGRACSRLSPTLSCCLPCPSSDWLFSNHFHDVLPVANYVSIVSFVLNALLLLTFLVLPEEQSHRHYLSVGLTVSLMMLALAFIIPLGTKPDMCFDTITPNNMYTDVGCAWTGALLEAGAMGIVVWIFLRAVWTLLRTVFDFRRTELYQWISLGLGIGLPAFFLAVAIPLAGVSYRLGNVCIPNNTNAFPTWFAWILIFATVASVLQMWTILFCFWKFALSAFARGAGSSATGSSATGAQRNSAGVPTGGAPATSKRRSQRVEWQRIKTLLMLQWRSIVLSFIVVNVTIYFGIVFIQQIGAEEMRIHAPPSPMSIEWAACLIETKGDAETCVKFSPGMGLSESRTLGTWILVSFIGPVVFLLMVRRSMFIGWYELLSNPGRVFKFFGRRGSVGSDEFISLGDTNATKHMSFTKHLGSDQRVASLDENDQHAEPMMAGARSRGDERTHSLEIGDERSVVGRKVDAEKMV